MKTSFYRFAALLLFAAALTAGCGERTDDMRLLYWNIQNGMWSDQSNGYDNFVAWVKGYDPDVCVWCEAQSIYKSGTAERMDSVDRYLTANWGELAARYGHKYWYVGGHRDNFPQVVTSKYPIENVQRIVGPSSRQHRFARRGLGPDREERQAGQYRDAPYVAAGVCLSGRGPRRPAGPNTAVTVTGAWRSSISARIRSLRSPMPDSSCG